MAAPVVMVGLPGSGMVEVAQMLRLCGVDLEASAISYFNQRLMRHIGGQWYAPLNLAAGWAEKPSLDMFRQEALALAEAHGARSNWGWADTDTAPTLEFWQSIFPQMRLVVCLRHPIDQAPELARQREGLSFEQALVLWHGYYQRLEAYSDQAVVTHYDTYLRDAPSELKRVLALLNVACDEEKIAQAAALFSDTPVEIPAGTLEAYALWRARSGDVYHAQTADPEEQAAGWQRIQREQAALAQQNAALQREVATLESSLEYLDDVILVASEGRVRRFKRRVKNYALGLLSKPREPAVVRDHPEISLVTVLDPAQLQQPKLLEATIQSVVAQSSPHWQWIIVCEAPPARLIEFSRVDPRVHLYPLGAQQTAAEAWNAALEQAASPYVLLLDPADRLAKTALADVGSVLRDHPDVDGVYSDTDSGDPSSRQRRPFFKPDWSPMLMYSINLLDGLFVFKREWLDRVGKLDAAMGEGAYWDFCWRIAEQAGRIHHIPAILCHRSRAAEAAQAQGQVQAAHVRRLGLSPQGTTPPRWTVSPAPKVSIIIPSRDKADLLGRCLDRLFTLTEYPDYEVIVVDTHSVEPATHALYDKYQGETRFRVVPYPKVEFNFSRACNVGAAAANGDLLLFLNNDTEALRGDWLSLMAQWFADSTVGIVGAKLLYPNGKIQHAGVILGLSGLVNHISQGCEENSATIFGSDRWYRNFLAVTGACLMISRAVFAEIDGFNEAYQLNFSDVELCLRVIERGYQVIYTPDVRLIHHEAQTHRYNIPYDDFERASRDFRDWLIRGDPFFNPNLSYTSVRPRKNELKFKTPYPNHLVAMKRIRMLAKR